jgi:sugar-specific transcriptional regulator TrmB
MKQTDLHSLGFTEKEAKVYLACLELGHGSAVQIAKKATHIVP